MSLIANLQFKFYTEGVRAPSGKDFPMKTKLTCMEWVLLALMFFSLIVWFVFLDQYFEFAVRGVLGGY